MALLLLLESRLGTTYTIPTDSNAKIDTSKLSIHFENEKENELLACWILECKISDNRRSFLNETTTSSLPKNKYKPLIFQK